MKKDKSSLGILLALVVTISYLHAQKIKQRDAFQSGTPNFAPVSLKHNSSEQDLELKKFEFTTPNILSIIF